MVLLRPIANFGAYYYVYCGWMLYEYITTCTIRGMNKLYIYVCIYSIADVLITCSLLIKWNMVNYNLFAYYIMICKDTYMKKMWDSIYRRQEIRNSHGGRGEDLAYATSAFLFGGPTAHGCSRMQETRGEQILCIFVKQRMSKEFRHTTF